MFDWGGGVKTQLHNLLKQDFWDISILNNSEIHEISIDEEQENEEDNRVMISEGGSSVVRILNLKEWLKNPWMPV